MIDRFRAWDKDREVMLVNHSFGSIGESGIYRWGNLDWMQFTGLTDKNGNGVAEVYEGDIIGPSSIVGNIYEAHPRETDLVIPQLGTKAWDAAYKEAVARGFDYAE